MHNFKHTNITLVYSIFSCFSCPVILEVYATIDCRQGDLNAVETSLRDYLSKNKGPDHCTDSEVTKYTAQEKVELKRCEVKCDSREDAERLAEEFKCHPKVEMVNIVQPPKEAVDSVCSIL